MLWLLSLLNDAMLLAATVPLAKTLDAVADAKREEIAAAPERAAGLGMVRWPLGRLLLACRTKNEKMEPVERAKVRPSYKSKAPRRTERSQVHSS